MRIGVIGAGRVGAGLARVWVEAGHDVTLSFSRDAEALRRTAEEIGASVGSPDEAARGADATLVAAPWSAMDEALAAAGDLTGAVLIDATNALGAGLGRPAGLELAARVPGAHVVKAFNTVFAQLFGAARSEEPPPSVVICGDDAGAKRIVEQLAADAGFAPVDAGGLEQSGDVEAFARLVIGLAYREGRGQFFYRLGTSAQGEPETERESG